MEEARIGVYICWCGTNIAKMVDVELVTERIKNMPFIVVAKNYKYMCSDPGQDLIVNDIKKHNLNRIVVAACSPRIHELTFRKAIENAGLNPYMFEMANIREHDSWVHIDRDEATHKAISLIAGAISRIRWHEALEKRVVEIHPATLIIGGGISGLSAALEIAQSGNQVFLIEKLGTMGGKVANLDLTYPYFYSAKQIIQPFISKVVHNQNIEIFLESEIKEISGYIGNFETTVHSKDGSTTKLNFGNIIVATGLKTFDPSHIGNYGYGKLPNVITSDEFEQMLSGGQILAENCIEPKNIAIIHCVGSRNADYHEYCSRTCCLTALKYANQIRSALPESNIIDIYADMRSFGKGCEELYALTSRKGIVFLMYDQQLGLPLIKKASSKDDCELIIEMNERLSGETIEVPADLVILMVGVEAHKTAKEIGHAVGISLCGNQFYIEKHPKLDPVATTTDGVYIVGACQSPKDIPDSITQAKAASARILATIKRGHVEVETTTAVVDDTKCCGCQTCTLMCPYTAITFIDDKKVSYVNAVLCKGCGTCGSSCPTGAIHCKHFTDKQILSQLEGILKQSLEFQEELK